MPIYEVEKHGKVYEVDAPSPQAAAQALARMPEASTSAPKPSTLDRLLDTLPAAGGMAGGIAGGIGGTAFGLGVGGVPGAVGGAALGGGLGQALHDLVQLARGKDAPKGAGEAAKDIGVEGGLQALYELGGAGVTRGLSSGAKAVYRGYLKPSLAKASISKADRVVKTAIDEALPITKAGETQANAVIKELRTEVDGILAKTPGTVDLHSIAERVRAFAKAKYFKAGKPTADFDAAMRVAEELDAHPSIMRQGPAVTREVPSSIVDAGGKPFTSTETIAGPRVAQTKASLSQANTVKRGLDESIGDANFGVDRGATKTTQKVARRYVRQDIEKLAPSVGAKNAREGDLIETAKAITRAIGRESNKSPLIGVNTLMSGAIGGGTYAQSGDPYAAAVSALAVRGALTPAVMTRAAIVASRLGRMHPGVPTNIARVAVQAVLQAEDQGNGKP